MGRLRPRVADPPPPLTENFLEVPVVEHEPYEYEHIVAKEKHLV